MKTGSRVGAGVLAISSLSFMASCSTSQEVSTTNTGGLVSLPAPAKTVEESKPKDFAIRVSKATAAGLRSMGLDSDEQIAAWYNQPLTSEDPFVDAFKARIRGAQARAGEAASLDDLDLSSSVLAVLDIYGVRTPAELLAFDLGRLDDGRRCEQVCRAEIANAMLREGWSCINASVTNRPRASRLMIDGELLGTLFASTRPASRRFLTRLPGTLWDRSRIVTLSVDVVDPESGLPPVRWFKDIELSRGGEISLSVDVAATPMPSIGIRPTRQVGPGVVYAGDDVELFLEGGSDQTVWMIVPRPRQLTAENLDPSPETSNPTVGLAVWFKLRRFVAESSLGRDTVLAGSDDPSRQIGIGSTMEWRPDFESPNTTIVALVEGPGGFWGMASRSVAVVDIRPGYWLTPELSLAESPPSTIDLNRALPPGSSMNIYLTHWVLSQLTYAAEVGESIAFDVRNDELLDASLPLENATVTFGDGTPAVRFDGSTARAGLTHRYAEPGTYLVSMVTEDSMGLARRQTTSIRVAPTPPPEPPKKAPAKPRPPVAVASDPSSTSTDDTSFDLLDRAVQEWAERIAEMTADSTDGRGLAIAHIHEAENQGLLDLLDHRLVDALLNEDVEVYEREPVFQAVLAARGFAIGGNVDLEGQRANQRDGLLDAATDHPDQAEGIMSEWLDRVDETTPPDCELLLDYKLKRAEVRVQEAGNLALRTARLLSFVRIHDVRSGRIVADATVTVELSDTAPRSSAREIGPSWDGYPDGFLMRKD